MLLGGSKFEVYNSRLREDLIEVLGDSDNVSPHPTTLRDKFPDIYDAYVCILNGFNRQNKSIDKWTIGQDLKLRAYSKDITPRIGLVGIAFNYKGLD